MSSFGGPRATSPRFLRSRVATINPAYLGLAIVVVFCAGISSFLDSSVRDKPVVTSIVAGPQPSASSQGGPAAPAGQAAPVAGPANSKRGTTRHGGAAGQPVAQGPVTGGVPGQPGQPVTGPAQAKRVATATAGGKTLAKRKSGGAPGPAVGSVASGDVQGITSTTVKVGFIAITDTQAYGTAGGFADPDPGDVEGQIKAMVAYANANGGLAGHQIIPDIHDYSVSNDSLDNETALCKSFTQDDKVWAVVLESQGYAQTRQCYAQAHVLVIDPSPFNYDRTFLGSMSPYYWSPSYVNYSRLAEAYVPALKAQNYFTNVTKLGVISYDVDTYHRTIDGSLIPALKAAGIDTSSKGLDVQYINNQDIPTISQQAGQVAVKFRGESVSHVIFIGLGPFAPLFISAAQGDGFLPRYAMNTYDNPRFTASFSAANPSVTLKNAVGIGFGPAGDVLDSKLPFPQPQEQGCINIMAAANQTFAARPNARYALSYCDSVNLLTAAGKGLGSSLSVQSWARQAAGLGTGFQAASSFHTTFAGGRYDGSDTYRYLAFDSSCTCFSYTSGSKTFGN